MMINLKTEKFKNNFHVDALKLMILRVYILIYIYKYLFMCVCLCVHLYCIYFCFLSREPSPLLLIFRELHGLPKPMR